MQSSYVYILTNKRNGTLYTGSTSDLIKRIWQHKNAIVPGFSQQYKTSMLVYYEVHGSRYAASVRERNIKNWKRAWKIALIEKFNPYWHDLYSSLL